MSFDLKTKIENRVKNTFKLIESKSNDDLI
ncbi:hypothetical protein F885_00471 [Acinetobacter higginsii]|nr:hypothetical protein F885_00471 [Acinetobacter higginsii]